MVSYAGDLVGDALELKGRTCVVLVHAVCDLGGVYSHTIRVLVACGEQDTDESIWFEEDRKIVRLVG
jgi:hypothetical protein